MSTTCRGVVLSPASARRGTSAAKARTISATARRTGILSRDNTALGFVRGEGRADFLQARGQRITLGRGHDREALIEDLFEMCAAFRENALAGRGETDQRLPPVRLVNPSLDPALAREHRHRLRDR